MRLFASIDVTFLDVLHHEEVKCRDGMARRDRGTGMKKVALSEVKDDLSRYLRVDEKEEVIITRHGEPAGVLIGFKSEDDWFDYRLENDPRFLARVESARQSLRAGRGVKLGELEPSDESRGKTRCSVSRSSSCLQLRMTLSWVTSDPPSEARITNVG